ncbi:ThiF family adenylyltransferase [Streptosporangium sp. KLBMP 9127]|nr:ThiF family adenylyltransferase [Streptosporangium sp. KLBMP 9127]
MTHVDAAPRHVVVSGRAAAALVAPGEVAGPPRMGLRSRDDGDLWNVDGTAGQEVVIVHGDGPAPVGPEIRLVCRAGDGGVRCFLPDGREIPATLVPDGVDLSGRTRGIIRADLLHERAVAILGLGSGGSFIARELAKAGVGRFLLLDHDRLEPGNIVRHECGIGEVGRLKVLAMRDVVRAHNPSAEIVTSTLHVDGESREQVLDLVRGIGARLVICATDTRESRLLINRMCVNADLTLILGGVFRRAYGGIVQRVIPRLTACYQCYVQALPDSADDNEISSEIDAARVSYTDRGVAPQPGLSTDIVPVALHMVKLALLELTGDESPAFASLRQDLVAPLFQWVNRRESAHAHLPPMGVSVDELSVLRWYGMLLPKLPDCVTCSIVESELNLEHAEDGFGE